MAAVTLLSTRNLERRFGGLTAVARVDFALAAGEIRAVIGPNGAGKTTFASLIAGRLKPSSGQIMFRDEDITPLPAFRRVRRGIAYTFQITSIFSRLTVSQNVALASRGDDPADVLDRVGLTGRAGQVAGTLAYGHQRLLEVAMGLALSPSLLILDEPTQGLSDSEIAGFIALIRSFAGAITVLIIEHNMQVVMDLAHRITVFDRGRILAEGTPTEIRGNRDVQNAYLGSP